MIGDRGVKGDQGVRGERVTPFGPGAVEAVVRMEGGGMRIDGGRTREDLDWGKGRIGVERTEEEAEEEAAATLDAEVTVITG